jgi:hypothetical protein
MGLAEVAPRFGLGVHTMVTYWVMPEGAQVCVYLWMLRRCSPACYFGGHVFVWRRHMYLHMVLMIDLKRLLPWQLDV